MSTTKAKTKADGAESASTEGLGVRLFPVLHPPTGCAAFVRWDALTDEWAHRVHGQSLERLAERGGLCPEEIFLNVRRLRWAAQVSEAEAIAVTNSIAPNVHSAS